VLGLAAIGAVSAGEKRLRADATHARIMRPASEERVAVELDRRVRAAERAGRPLSDAEVMRAHRQLEREHRDFPFWTLLTVAAVIGGVLGALRSRAAAENVPLRGRAVALACAGASAAVALVVILDSLSAR
jgi:hypothetical protein